MTESNHAPTVDLAIIGGGAAGVLTAIHALRQARPGLQLALIEPDLPLARGVAYATGHEGHLLNVPAGKMSGFADVPDDFLDYLCQLQAYPELDRDALARHYVSRRHYAAYLQLRLRQAQQGSAAQLQLVNDSVSALQPEGDGLRLVLGDGSALRAGAVSVAVGNTLRPLPAPGAQALSRAQRVEAWDYPAVQAIDPGADVCIVGSGLSMADSVVSLLANGHRGVMHVVSRHALLPLPHAEGGAADFDPQPLLAMNLRQRLRGLRQHARQAQAQGLPWQAVMDRIRPLGQALWQSLSAADQRRFLRHVVRYWDVHRHRIAPSVHAQLQALRERGQLQLHRGRIDAVSADGDHVRLTGDGPRGSRLHLQVQCVVNATGVETRGQAMRNPLLQQLLASGLARPGPHGIGLDTAPDGQLLDADGTPHPRIQVIGSLRIGSLWESLAIPELRVQAAQAAQRMLAQAGLP